MRLNVRKLGALCATGVLVVWCNAAVAQTLSDELQVTLPNGKGTTLIANDAANGSEPILEFVQLNNPQDSNSFMDNSTAITSNLVSTSSTGTTGWSSNVSSWYSSKVASGTLKEFIVTEPNSTTPSDVILTFTQTSIVDTSVTPNMTSSNVNVVALISDPVLVAAIASFNSTIGMTTPISQLPTMAESGALQDVTSFLYGSTAGAPFTAQMLSAVPEPGSWLLLLGGLAAVRLARWRPGYGQHAAQ